MKLAVLAALATSGMSACAGPRPTTMHAIQYRAYGASTTLELVELPVPVPEAGEVLVKVDAAAVNTIDWENRREALPGFAPRLPVVPGYDLAGEIVARGPGVVDHALGERVFAMLPLDSPRAYAEYARVPVTVLARQPRNLDAIHAAAVPLVALTAWQALFEAGGLHAGQTVLIHGASGGVGHLAVQLAKHAGATVIGTASRANLAFVRSLGADQVIDYRAQPFETVVRDVDLVFDTVGGDTLARSYQVVRAGGTVVSIAGRIDAGAASARGIHGKGLLVRPDAAQLAQIAALLEHGALKPEIDTVYPLRDAALAHDKSETRHLRGRLVLQVSPPAAPTR
jgi:NADPH:quinone reductase-like Zn-dependent oxidoreductase